VLTLENPTRFRKNRDVGSYLGSRPKLSQSGDRSPQLGISKKGDSYLRKLLVGSANISLAGLDVILTYDAGDWNWPKAVALMRRSVQLLRLPVNRLSYFIGSGSINANTNRSEVQSRTLLTDPYC
jgi:hypothetical protein